mgnify:CR=1 FL=1
MYEARQNKEKVSRTISGSGMARQMVNMKKNETILNTIQRYFGKPDSTVVCNASVRIIAKKKSKSRPFHEKFLGEGGSDTDSRGSVINTFTRFGLTNLANVNQAIHGNPPGQCAEPHAIADALNDLRSKEKLYFRYEINNIDVESARVANPTTAMINRGYQKGNIMPRCTTCAQWVPDNHVLNFYLH